jgi:hypothetical protein
MKHLKHASETLAKTRETVKKYTQHLNKTLANMCETYATSRYTCNICLKNRRNMGTKACNIYVQPLQHIQHLDLLATSI